MYGILFERPETCLLLEFVWFLLCIRLLNLQVYDRNTNMEYQWGTFAL